MNDEEFESMVARLIRLEFPDAFKPANTSDGGADMVLPAGGDRYRRCWQAKHFPSNIRWAKCEKSLADASTHWRGISEYTFVFPRDLTVGEQKTFDKKFRGNHATIEVNHWGGTELQARLTGSAEGERVARTFFDVDLSRERLERLAEAGGPLETHEDALDRLGTVGGFLSSGDAYFHYPTATHEAGLSGPPPTPGSVMSIGEVGEVARRIDVVPRDDEALERYGPEFVLDASEGEKGKEAAVKLEDALREGKEVEIGEGLELTFTKLPPALSDLEGKRLTGGSFKLGPAERLRPRVEPFTARLAADTDRGRAQIDVELHQLEAVPEGWDDAFAGTVGPMTVTEVARRVDTGGEVRWNFHYRRDASPVRDQLAALQFLNAVGGTGVLEFSRRGSGGEPLRSPTEPAPTKPEHQALIAFFEDVRAIEEWTGVEYELPEEISAEDATKIRQMATIIRNGGVAVTWKDLELVVPESGVEKLNQGSVLRIEREAQLQVLGKTVPVGYTTLDITEYEVDAVERSADDPEQYVVRVRPPDGSDADLFEALRKERTEARKATGAKGDASRRSSKPPPPPPRKGRRKRSKKRRR